MAFGCAWCTLSPVARAVVPPPDGFYPGFNTAEGQNALFSLTTGSANTAVGWFSLWGNAEGSFNTADQNTAFGAAALLFNTLGFNNTAVGAAALLNNTDGSSNTATGTSALFSNTAGSGNTANGAFALFSNTIGSGNTANGLQALFSNTGTANTANGYQALFSNTGIENTANGYHALFSNTTGNDNTADGREALSFNTTGSNNIALGAQAGIGVTTASNVICIGAGGQSVSNSCYIGQIFGVTSSGGTAVFIDATGRLGTATSSRRFKEEIKPMERASEALFALKPITFRYKKGIDPLGVPQFGLVAEDVEEVNPDLVVRDREGKVNTVRYEAVNAMLLNEFLKEHRKVEKLQAELEAVNERLKEQEAKMDKVSAHLDLNKRALRALASK